MIEMLSQSQGNLLGFKAVGTIKPADYDELVPMVENAIKEQGSVRLLIDMEDFKSESPSAWKADFHFGREFHQKIVKLAIVGDKRWEKWMTEFCAPFYAVEAKFFHTDDMVAAWDWLRE
jgi:hypothetical protein